MWIVSNLKPERQNINLQFLEDEVRDRFRDHVIMGPILSKAEDIDGEHCKKFCSRTPEASFYR